MGIDRTVKIMWCVPVTEEQSEDSYEHSGLKCEMGGNGITGEDIKFFVGVADEVINLYIDDCIPLELPREMNNSHVLDQFIAKHNITEEPKWWIITSSF